MIIAPMCVKCGTAAKLLTINRDPAKSGSIVTAECHGEKDHVFVSDRTMYSRHHAGGRLIVECFSPAATEPEAVTL